ncbi:bifunctional riboflavin kinase/FAD synthetase [Aquibacillus koreensis]|uniref:Riboflavin biosynthesis protein n=2 Tax=Aquibacillus koreensis TaxID=279446 RepID=A0A9X3WMW4_9BACI|nr:bifunctional riboflavin kinase/FAD synthetase [Aquibacillus koreensis]MCT2535485.1 bifunctional riboflavin kinase/FAD synthetase [Aquibacillus koreensis]MDC3422702.1 bifunctional riboflavin kinase/FAD synthetase [Aquibacillus koreensis]
MDIIDVKEKPPLDSTPLTLVIGKFDGVHKGHQLILQVAREKMDSSQETLAVMGFSDQPLWVLRQDEAYEKKITPDRDKFTLLKQYGVGRYYRVAFTKEYAATTAEAFVKEHLAQLQVKRIVIGEGFRFGKGASSSTDALIRLCTERNIEVVVVPLVKINGTPISSTKIRGLLKEGLMEAAQSLLGRPFTVTGIVVHGQKMGRKLGFPTINMGEMEAFVEPKPGVYLGVVGIYKDGVITDYRDVLISAGYRPSVNGQGYLIEAHILNYSGDLYDQTVSVSFLRYLREEIKFTNLDDLIEQMEQDRIQAEQLLATD